MTSSAVASIDPARPGRQAAARCPSSARPRDRGHREHLFGWADTNGRLVGADLVLRQRQAQPRSLSPRPVGRSVTSGGMDGMTPDIASPPSSVSERRGSTRSGQILARLRYPVWHGSSLSGPSVLVPRHGATSPDRAGGPSTPRRRSTRPASGRVRRCPYSGPGDRRAQPVPSPAGSVTRGGPGTPAGAGRRGDDRHPVRRRHQPRRDPQRTLNTRVIIEQAKVSGASPSCRTIQLIPRCPSRSRAPRVRPKCGTADRPLRCQLQPAAGPAASFVDSTAVL